MTYGEPGDPLHEGNPCLCGRKVLYCDKNHIMAEMNDRELVFEKTRMCFLIPGSFGSEDIHLLMSLRF